MNYFFSWLQKPYPLPETRGSQFKMASLLSLVVALFLFVFRPFNQHENTAQALTTALIGGATVFVTIYFHFLVLYPLFPRFFREERWTIARELIWTLVVIVSIAMTNMAVIAIWGGFPVTWRNLWLVIIDTTIIGIAPATVSILINQARLLRRYRRQALALNEVVHRSAPNAGAGDQGAKVEEESSVDKEVESVDKGSTSAGEASANKEVDKYDATAGAKPGTGGGGGSTAVAATSGSGGAGTGDKGATTVGETSVNGGDEGASTVSATSKTGGAGVKGTKVAGETSANEGTEEADKTSTTAGITSSIGGDDGSSTVAATSKTGGAGAGSADLTYAEILAPVPQSARITDHYNIEDTIRPVELGSSITLSAEIGKDQVTVTPADLLAISSADNYCKVYLRDGGRVKTAILRSPLKRLEGMLASHPYFWRCHRTAIVNLETIGGVSGTAQGYRLEIEGMEETIPVSRSLNAQLREKLGARKAY